MNITRNIRVGSPADFVRAFRPNTDPAKFAAEDLFKIRAIRAFARRLSRNKEITDYQIIHVCHKAGIVRRAPEKGALLEDLNETMLFRIERWLSTNVFAQGYDDYFANQWRIS